MGWRLQDGQEPRREALAGSDGQRLTNIARRAVIRRGHLAPVDDTFEEQMLADLEYLLALQGVALPRSR